MTGPSRRHAEEIPDALRQFIRHEQDGLPTAALARIRTIDEESQRATVETLPDGAKLRDVPIAAPYAADGTGDIAPLNPRETGVQVTGIVLYLHHDVEAALGTGDSRIRRDHRDESIIFIPAMVWGATDSVPDHDDGERVIGHPSGAEVRIKDDSVRVIHPGGTELDLGAIPEPETTEMAEAMDEDRIFADEDAYLGTEPAEDPEDYTQWPVGDPGDAYARLSHPSGASFTISDERIAIETDGHEITLDAPIDGERRVLDGPYQHAQLLEHDDGQYSLVGEPLSFREFCAWLTEPTRLDQLKNRDSGWVEEASIYAEAYLAWLEDVLGEPVDPTDPEAWPDPEPMPPDDVKETFHP